MSMRLSTNLIFSQSRQAITRQQSEVANIGQQLASQRRVVTPADDPRAAAQAVVTSQAGRANEQYAATRGTARNALAVQETELGRVTDTLASSVKPLLVQAGNGTLSDADRESVALELDGIYEQMVSSANARDGNGNYVFSGFDYDSPAFRGERGELTYAGDDGQRELRVDGNRRMAVNDSGASIVASTTASAKYVARAGADNAGSASFEAITVRDSGADDYGDSFAVEFADDGNGGSTYSVRNLTTDTTVVDAAAYEAGAAIDIGDSMQLRFEGSPEPDDTFTLGRGRSEDANILNTIANVADALRQPTDNEAAAAALSNTVNAAQRQTDNALDTVSAARSSIGSRLGELDTLDTIGATRKIQYDSRLSELRDVDPVKAISDYTLASVALQFALQFAQKTFTDIEQLSLFNLT